MVVYYKSKNAGDKKWSTNSEDFIYRCHMLFWNWNYGDGI